MLELLRDCESVKDKVYEKMRSQMQSLVTLILFSEENRIRKVTDVVSQFTDIKHEVQQGDVKTHGHFAKSFKSLDVSTEMEIYKKKLVCIFYITLNRWRKHSRKYLLLYKKEAADRDHCR